MPLYKLVNVEYKEINDLINVLPGSNQDCETQT